MVLGTLLAVALAWAPAVRAQDRPVARAAVTLAPGSELWLEGKSTVHEFESKTSTLGFVLQRNATDADPADPAAIAAWIRAAGVCGLDLTVPLATMRSGKDALDKNMLKAMNAAAFPEVRFHLTRPMLGTAVADTLPMTAEGTLTISGKERAVSVTGRVIKSALGVWLEGRHSLLMSDYGIKPPVMMLGALRVKDEIIVRFRLLLVAGDKASGQAAIPNR